MDHIEEPTPADIRLVITASSLGTVFEWYDFFIYGTLAASGIIGRTFFPGGSEIVQIFGYLGDRLGRKYTFLVTIALMGVATAGVGLVPSAASIGFAAPVLVLLLRIAQGLALGGEYGGAAVYVAEHSPPGKSGFYTSFIQAGVVGGFILSLAVVLATKSVLSASDWGTWGWRLPFLFSLALLAISLWMRLKLSESPVFTAMRAAGERAKNPLRECFTYPGNLKRMFVALFGIAAGLTVVWYTAMFTVLSFLSGPMRVAETTAQMLAGAGALMGLVWFVAFGRLSDRIGRKIPIVWGYAATLVLIFPLFWGLAAVANPGLATSARAAPVVVSGPHCAYSPFAKEQGDACGRLIDHLSKKGVAYTTRRTPGTVLAIGGVPVPDHSIAGVDTALAKAGYDLSPVQPTGGRIVQILLLILAITALSGATYGPVAALLSEMFPPAIRYSSLSIPYHIGAGYFGGFLPFISQYIVARTGDPFAGLWYTWAVTLMALVVTVFGLREEKRA